MFGKTKESVTEHPLRIRARSRMERLPDHEILNWADQAGSGVAKALDDFRRLKTVDSLREVEEGLAALSGAVDVLNRRY